MIAVSVLAYKYASCISVRKKLKSDNVAVN